jgi:type VI secretion system protein ImpC
MPANMDYDFSFGGGAEGTRREQKPFNLLVLGNFSGQAGQQPGSPNTPVAKRKIVSLDLDNREGLWSVFEPALTFRMKSGSIDFAPRDIDDFHPDELYRNLPIFADLRKLRKDLQDPATAQSALDEIMSDRAVIEGEVADEPGKETKPEEEGGDMFERLLGKQSTPSPARKTAANLKQLDTFIQELVAPHIVHEPDPRVETAVNSVDLAIAELMRALLHHPDFQALESSWRSLFDTVAELELDENLQLYVCDVSREELLGALPDPGVSLQDSSLFELLVNRRRQAADDSPWAVIVADYSFGPEPEDIALLTALGAAAAVNGSIVLGGAQPAILGCKSSAELADARYWSTAGDDSLWQSLRKSAVAQSIGLALPRVLNRLPYGGQTDPIDSFEFEEMPQRNHEDYLWANPALACGRLLAQSFSMRGWDMDADDTLDLGVLPAHNYTEDGEKKLQPCAELLLSESTMVAMLAQGLMPLISYRNRNTAVVGRFQSIAQPATALDGPWNR